MSSAPFITDTTGGQIIEAIDRVSSAILTGAVDSTGTTASGNPLSIPDALPADVKSCVVEIEPIQAGSGTPSPSNVRPISGIDSVVVKRTGKNLCGEIERGGFSSEGLNADSTNRLRTKDYIPVVEGQTYTLSFVSNITGVANASVSYYNKNDYTTPRLSYFNWSASPATFTVPSGVSFARITFKIEDIVIAPSSLKDVQLELGTTATAYEEYNGQTTTIPIGQTVYGGTLDVKSGVLTVDKAIVDLGTKGYSYNSSDKTFYFAFAGAKGYFSSEQANAISSAFNCVSNAVLKSDLTLDASFSIYYEAGNVWANIRCLQYGSDTNAFGTAMSGVQLCYELTTPTTIQLTPHEISLLKGANVITVNGNTIIAVEYHPDIVPYVDSKLDDAVSSVDAMISDNVEGNTASKAYAVNDYLIRPDGFYKVTAPIANGAALTNNNVLLSTIAKELTKIANFLSTGGAGFHNSIYRGKYLGSSVTPEQWLAISSGTFYDMFIGDHWLIDNVIWRIAIFDPSINKGPNGSITTAHHLGIVPDSNLLAADGSTTHYMNDTDVTTDGYKSTGFHSGTNPSGTPNSAKNDCKAIINAAFGSGHILTHKELITSAVQNGKAIGWEWADCDVELMSELMVYGTPAWAANGYEVGTEMTQLPLFFFKPEHITNRANWWLRSVSSASNFAYVSSVGYAAYYYASYTWVGVRPYFLLTA